MKWLNPHKRGKKSPHAAEGEEKARYNAGAQNEASFKLCPLSADVSRKNGDFRKKYLPVFRHFRANGAGGIRTPDTFRYNGFQDRRLKPLGHCSKY